jgi:hypothetical protein
VGSMSFFDAVRNTIPARTMIWVLPGAGAVEYSQDRIAKKKEPMIMSAATAGGESRRAWVASPVDSNRHRSSFGVMAFWRFGAGSALS